MLALGRAAVAGDDGKALSREPAKEIPEGQDPDAEKAAFLARVKALEEKAKERQAQLFPPPKPQPLEKYDDAPKPAPEAKPGELDIF
jgi:hypothetical protein